MSLLATEKHTESLYMVSLKALSHTGNIIVVRHWVSCWIPNISFKQSTSQAARQQFEDAVLRERG